MHPIIEAFLTQFQEKYSPHCEQAFDEAMIPFQGRSSLKQYLPAKPVKRGIKVWCRSDSHNGYISEFQIYTGRSYIFWFLFEVSISNSFIMYIIYKASQPSKYGHFTRQNPAPKSFLDYRVQLYHQLVGDYNSRKRPGRGQTARSSLAIHHFPIKERSGSRNGMSRCWFCAHSCQPPRRKETVWYCGDCHLHLCHTGERDGSDCFLLYHQHMYT